MTQTSIIALQEGCYDIAKGLRKNEDFGRMDESKKGDGHFRKTIALLS
jgi:hypothetical protein